VDWTGYLTQQRRWARSVLDIKLRLQSSLAAKLPNQSRLASYLHGLSYLQPSLMLLLLAAVALRTILRGDVPPSFLRLNPAPFAGLLMVLTACYFFRQIFFLDPRNEWGIHWRARLLRFAKAPFLLLAVADVVTGKRFDYIMTPKTRQTGEQHLLLAPFGGLACVVAVAWIAGFTHGPPYGLPGHIAAVIMLVLCGGLIVSERMPVAEPFDPGLLTQAVHRKSESPG
jgi:cellulose synthase (UDP-forming)